VIEFTPNAHTPTLRIPFHRMLFANERVWEKDEVAE